MKKLIPLIVIIALVFNINKSYAQDLIYKKNKEVLVVKIIELGTDEIKYKDFNNQSGITLVIDKTEVYKVKFETGKEVMMADMNNPNQYASQKKSAIKVDFLAPMFGQFTFGYERSLKPGSSIEFQLGLIGLGINNYTSISPGASCSGAFVRAGYKFIRTPDFYLKGMRYSHILKGSYIRPEITFGQCTENYRLFNYNTGNFDNLSHQVSIGAIMINFGKQWVMNDFFLVDYFFGLGYGFSSASRDLNNTYFDGNPYFGNSHAFLGPYGGSPLSWNAGLKIGILLK